MAQIGFPLDSKIVGYDGSGLPVYSNQYFSEDFRNVLRNFFSNGVVSSGEELRPVAYSLGSNTVEATVRPGSAIINGAMFTSDAVEAFSLPVPAAPSSGEAVKHYHIVIGLDTSKTNGDEQMTMYVKPAIANKTPQEDLTRTAVKYEICIMTVTITVAQNEPYVTFVDRRLDPEWCGIAAPFAELDTSQIYEALNAEIQKLNKQTEIAVELAQDALNDTVAGNLTERIVALEDDAAFLANGIEINSGSINTITVPGNYYIESDDLENVSGLPDDWHDYFTRLYVFDIGKNIASYESVMQVIICRYSYETGKWKSDIRTRILNRDSATVVGVSPWQKILSGKISADDIEDGSIDSDKLENALKTKIDKYNIDDDVTSFRVASANYGQGRPMFITTLGNKECTLAIVQEGILVNIDGVKLGKVTWDN